MRRFFASSTFILFALSSSSVFALTIVSPTLQYDVCKRVSGGESPSDVYIAVMSPRGSPSPHIRSICDSGDRSHESVVVVKCEKPNADGEDLVNEIEKTRILSGAAPWSVNMVENFTLPPRGAGDRRLFQCYSMRVLGRSLREIREKSGKQFDLPTLASIGLQMVRILKSLHNDFGLYHTDVHAANWLVRIDDPTKLALIDYGYMVPLSGDPSDRIKELQEMIITLRWYTDLNDAWYVPKKILRRYGEINLDMICPPATVPRELRGIIEYIMSLTPASFNPAEDYDLIAAMFTSILGVEDIEGVLWRDPKHTRLLHFAAAAASSSAAAARTSSVATTSPSLPRSHATPEPGEASAVAIALDQAEQAAIDATVRASLQSLGLGL